MRSNSQNQNEQPEFPPVDLLAPPASETLESDQPPVAPLAEKPPTPPTAKPGQTIREQLLDDAGGSIPGCTCGKKPGTRGRHKKDCDLVRVPDPVDTNPVFAPFPDVAPQNDFVVSDQSNASPGDFSFYGKAAEKVYSIRAKYKQLAITQKIAPVLGEKLAEEFAAEFVIDPEDLADLKNDLMAGAEANNWPKVNPLAKVLLTVTAIEMNWLVTEKIITRKLDLILKAQRRAPLQEEKTPENPKPAVVTHENFHA